MPQPASLLLLQSQKPDVKTGVGWMPDRFKLLFAVFCNILEVLYNSVIDIARSFYGVKIPRVRVRPHEGHVAHL